MFIYIFMFFISTIAVLLGEKSSGKKRKIFFALGIIIPCLLAANRAMIIGTDTGFYMKPIFDVSINIGNFGTLATHWKNFEFGYLSLTYIVAKLTGNIKIFLFIIQFIIQFFTFKACEKNSKIVPIWFSYLIFLLLYYNRSLNMCRQTIALAIILYAYSYFIEKKYVKFVLFILFASLFHSTALLAIPLFFLIYFIKNDNKIIKKVLIFSLLFIGIIFYVPIINMLVNYGIISSRYLTYAISSNHTIIRVELIQKYLVVLTLIVFWKVLNKDNEKSTLSFIMVMDLLLYHVGFYANYAQRISYYYGYFNIFAIAMIPDIFKDKKTKNITRVLIIFILLIYWWYYYAFLGADHTIPYIPNNS